MIEKGFLEKIDTPTPKTIIVYRTPARSISHVGLMENKDTVISKWSRGPLLRHAIFAVPYDYGDTVEFYTLKPEAVDHVLKKRNGN